MDDYLYNKFFISFNIFVSEHVTGQFVNSIILRLIYKPHTSIL
jgi:hypothetical protein